MNAPKPVTLQLDPAQQRERVLAHLASPSCVGNLTIGQVFKVFRHVEAQLRHEYRWHPFHSRAHA
jgi:hypothetical protein